MAPLIEATVLLSSGKPSITAWNEVLQPICPLHSSKRALSAGCKGALPCLQLSIAQPCQSRLRAHILCSLQPSSQYNDDAYTKASKKRQVTSLLHVHDCALAFPAREEQASAADA